MPLSLLFNLRLITLIDIKFGSKDRRQLCGVTREISPGFNIMKIVRFRGYCLSLIWNRRYQIPVIWSYYKLVVYTKNVYAWERFKYVSHFIGKGFKILYFQYFWTTVTPVNDFFTITRDNNLDTIDCELCPLPGELSWASYQDC